MSLAPEPQVESPQFHMADSDNCVLMVSVLRGAHFHRPRSKQTAPPPLAPPLHCFTF